MVTKKTRTEKMVEEETDERCPECGSTMQSHWRNGEFVSYCPTANLHMGTKRLSLSEVENFCL